MLIGLQIRDVVLIEALDLSIGPGLTALTGETGAGKSIILDALGPGRPAARGDAGLVRRGAAQAGRRAAFAPAPDHPVWDLLEDKGPAYARDEDLVLRRTLSADGRSRAFVNDQATGVGVLKELGEALLGVHGQHETVGLLDARASPAARRLRRAGRAGAGGRGRAWAGWREARERVEALKADVARSAAEVEELTFRLLRAGPAGSARGRGDGPCGGARILGAPRGAGRHRRRAWTPSMAFGAKVAQAIRAFWNARGEARADCRRRHRGARPSRAPPAAAARRRWTGCWSSRGEAEAAIDNAAARLRLRSRSPGEGRGAACSTYAAWPGS